MMVCRVLGPIEVEVGETVVDIGGAVPRRFLAALALGDGRPVSDTRVAELVWGDDPPASIHKSLPVIASRVRTVLGPEARHHLDRTPTGYLLKASFDHTRFTELVAAGRQLLVEGDAVAAEEALEAALGLWRGAPFADLGDVVDAVGPRTRLAELHAVAVEELHAARLAQGDAAAVVAALGEAVTDAPYRERRWELLAIALYRCGRQADALAELRRVRDLLIDELGIEPGPALRDLESRVLAQDPTLLLAQVEPRPSRRSERAVRAYDLVGRNRELAELAARLDRASGGGGGDVVVVHGPRGSGRSALAGAAADLANRRGFEVVRASQVRTTPDLSAWSQLLRDLGGRDELPARLLADPSADTLEAAAREVIDGPPRLVVIDDIDHGGQRAIAMLAICAGRASAGSTVVLATSATPLGFASELTLRGLSQEELAAVVDPEHGFDPDTITGLRVASQGRPGVAVALAADLAVLPAGDDPIVHLAVSAVSAADFLVVDDAVFHLLELALPRARDAVTRARVLARLARELLGDASAVSRRASLAREALVLARAAGDRRVIAEVLDSHLHAVWEPDGAQERLDSGAEIEALARSVGDDELMGRGLFWRFTGLVELGRITEAEVVLAAVARASVAAADVASLATVAARHGMLALMRGRYDELPAHVADVVELGRRGGVADADRLVSMLRGQFAIERNVAALNFAVDAVRAGLPRLPGQLMESDLAHLLALQGRTAEASAELQRALPEVLAATGPRWVGAVGHLSVAAVATGDTESAERLHRVLLPYRGRIVVLGGANSCWGTVSYHLGRLDALLGRNVDAVKHFQEALALEEEIGALPWQAHTLAALADVLEADGEDGVEPSAVDVRARSVSIAGQLGMTVLLDRLKGS